MVLIPEVTPEKLAKFGLDAVDIWVQIACPRLSIDWGEGFEEHTGVPVITPYEADVALGNVDPWWNRMAEANDSETGTSGSVYPMVRGRGAMISIFPMDNAMRCDAMSFFSRMPGS